MTLVSIGMPVYNGAKYLPEALSALSAQDFPDMEALVSDNASTDETPDILSAFAARDPRIRWHRQDTNIGPVRNYDWVLHNTKGPWFAFAAHDDGWSPNYVSALHGVIAARPGTLLAAPRVVMMDTGGKHGRAHPFPEEINAAPKLKRAILGLRHASASWFHGIAERAAFTKAWENSRRFGHVWGFDPLVVLPFLLAGATGGSNEAVFYRRETGLSDEKYRPRAARDQWAVYRDFTREALWALRDAPLSPAERALLLPHLFFYLKHGGKIRRILRAALRP